MSCSSVQRHRYLSHGNMYIVAVSYQKCTKGFVAMSGKGLPAVAHMASEWWLDTPWSHEHSTTPALFVHWNNVEKLHKVKDEVVCYWFLSTFTVCTPFWFWTNREANWHSQQHLIRLLATSMAKALHVKGIGKSTQKESYSQLLCDLATCNSFTSYMLFQAEMQSNGLEVVRTVVGQARSNSRQPEVWSHRLCPAANEGSISQSQSVNPNFPRLANTPNRIWWTTVCLKDPKRASVANVSPFYAKLTGKCHFF